MTPAHAAGIAASGERNYPAVRERTPMGAEASIVACTNGPNTLEGFATHLERTSERDDPDDKRATRHSARQFEAKVEPSCTPSLQ